MRSRVRWSACYTVVGTATSAATPKRSSCSQVARSDIRVEMNPVELPRLTTPARSEFPKRNSIGPSDRSAYLPIGARRNRFDRAFCPCGSTRVADRPLHPVDKCGRLLRWTSRREDRSDRRPHAQEWRHPPLQRHLAARRRTARRRDLRLPQGHDRRCDADYNRLFGTISYASRAGELRRVGLVPEVDTITPEGTRHPSAGRHRNRRSHSCYLMIHQDTELPF